MATYTIMRTSGGVSLDRIYGRHGVQEPSWPNGFMRSEALGGMYPTLCYLSAELKSREMYSEDLGKIIKDEDCAPTIRKAWLHDLTSLSEGTWAVRGPQGVVDRMLGDLKKSDVKLVPDIRLIVPGDTAEWLVREKGMMAVSYKLSRYPIANGKLEGTGTFKVIGEQDHVDDVEEWTEKISLKGGRPSATLSVRRYQVEVGDKRATTVLGWICEYLTDARDEPEDD